MGNPSLDGRLAAVQSDGIINHFYTPAAWIEGKAEDQLNHVATWAGVTKIAAFPDLHPGKYGPVGCAVLSDRIYPQLIGSDIGCGMSLFQLDLPLRKFKLEKALRRIRVLGEAVSSSQADRLNEAGLSGDLFASAMGTIGGGNHFCEVQVLSDLNGCDLDSKVLYLLIHSGSRGLGNAILNALPQGAFDGLDGDVAASYVRDHDPWTCRAYVPVSELIYAAFRSNAKGLLPPSDEWRRRGL